MPLEQIARGYKTQCLLDFETSFGTAPETPAGKVLPINSFGLNVSRNKTSAETLTGRRDPAEPFDGNVEVAGDVTVPVDTRAFGYWLKLVLGTPTTTAVEGETGVYSHVFKVTDNNPSGLVQCQYGTNPLTYGLFNGVKAASMNISTGGDEELTASISLAGKSVAYSENNYNASADLVTLKRLNNFQAALKKDGTTFATVTQFDFTVDNGLDTGIRTIGGEGMVYDIPEGIMSVTGTMTALFTSLDLLNNAKNSTEMALELEWKIDANNLLRIAFPEVQLQYQSPSVDGAQGILAEYPFVSYFADGTENSVVVATLINDVASY